MGAGGHGLSGGCALSLPPGPYSRQNAQHEGAAFVGRIVQRRAASAGLLVIHGGALAEEQVGAVQPVKVHRVHQRRAAQRVEAVNRDHVVLQNLCNGFAVARARRTMELVGL